MADKKKYGPYNDPSVPPSQQPKVTRSNRYLDTFARKTIYIEQGILELIQDLASNRRGEQTRIINAALSNFLAMKNPPRYHRPDTKDLARKTVYIEKNLLTAMLQATGPNYEQVAFVHDALTNYFNDTKNIKEHSEATDWFTEAFWKELKIGRIKLKD
jgi:hypothetical protein